MASRHPRVIDADGFRAPKRRNRPGKNRPPSSPQPRPSEVLSTPLSSATLSNQVPLDHYALEGVMKWKAKLKDSAYWKAITQLESFSAHFRHSDQPSTSASIPSRKINKVICLGLGSLATGDFAVGRSRPQLAFLLLLLDLINSATPQEESKKSTLRLGICDPLFTASDVALVRHFGFEILENCCGAYNISTTLSSGPEKEENSPCGDGDREDGGVLCFMPHCPKELYASILVANWNAQDLQRMVIIGNSFTSITTALASDVEKLRNGRIYEVEKVQTMSLFPDYEDPFVFNNTAIHIFDKISTITPEDDFWKVTEKEQDTLKSSFGSSACMEELEV